MQPIWRELCWQRENPNHRLLSLLLLSVAILVLVAVVMHLQSQQEAVLVVLVVVWRVEMMKWVHNCWLMHKAFRRN